MKSGGDEMATDRSEAVSTKSLILIPALITLAVTILRLVGELQGWSPRLFSRQAGGAGAIVGIVWLVPIFGAYFAWKLAKAGPSPAAGRVIAHGALAFGFIVLTIVVVSKTIANQRAQFGLYLVASVVAAVIAHRGWPALGRTLLAYGLAARVPVALVMLVAIFANWGTHYDVAPPNFPEMAPLQKWLMIGLVPQMLLWIPFTMYVGALFGGLALLAARGRREVPSAGTPGFA
jgi:hypothetical protein